jgi:hypothetical protein
MTRMIPNVDDFYQRIGEAAFDAAPDAAGRLALYAEIEDGAISADLFYVDRPGNVRFRFCPRELSDLIDRFWDAWRQASGASEWRTMCFVVDEDGTFSVDLKYPDQIDAREGLSDRRPRIVASLFPGMAVDYSRP